MQELEAGKVEASLVERGTFSQSPFGVRKGFIKGGPSLLVGEKACMHALTQEVFTVYVFLFAFSRAGTPHNLGVSYGGHE